MKSRNTGKKLIKILFFFLLVTQICFAQWYHQSSGTTINLKGVSFYNLSNGIVVGDSGIILSTTNGGTNWTVTVSGNNKYLYAVSYKSGNWVAVGSEGTILRNGIIQTSGTTNNLLGVSFTDANMGTAVGWDGTILRTTNGGTTWTEQTSGTTERLEDVSFTDANNGTVVGFGGTILRTTNGGTTWTEQTSGTNNWLSSVSFTDADNGWAVGWNGTILHTTNGGVSFIEEEQIDEVPRTYFLSNNFPNPFNPSTKIKYSVPQSSNIILKVFDVLGNEIETLVDEEKPAGKYEVEFDASTLTSGVYFYQLDAGDFVQTKKMILLK
jgi:hypothetical protein